MDTIELLARLHFLDHPPTSSAPPGPRTSNTAAPPPGAASRADFRLAGGEISGSDPRSPTISSKALRVVLDYGATALGSGPERRALFRAAMKLAVCSKSLRRDWAVQAMSNQRQAATSRLVHAVVHKTCRDVEAVEKAVMDGACIDLQVLTPDGLMSPLQMSIRLGSMEAFTCLAKWTEDRASLDSALTYVVSRLDDDDDAMTVNQEMMLHLVKLGASAVRVPSVLHVANSSTVVAWLLGKFPTMDLNAVNSDGESALFSAIQRGRFCVAKVLVQKGARISVQSLYCATACGAHEVLDMMLRCIDGDVVEIVNEVVVYGVTLLHHAALRGYRDAVDVLLRHGARADAVTTSGQSVVMMAAGAGHRDLARYIATRAIRCTNVSSHA